MEKQTTYKELRERRLITHEGGGTLDEILKKPRKVYLGVDPSADSLHIGNLVPIILVKHLLDLGHEPSLLVGGATGMVGDPRESGERTLLENNVLKKNTHALKSQLSTILGKKKLKVFDNKEWLSKLNLIEFLRDVGKHFSVNQLIKRDIIKRRLDTEEDSISYTEFSYSLLQAYDFFFLFDKYGINLQVGGSDQWANIVSGVDLIRRKTGQSAYALTTPIVVDKVTGKKFGKSEGNAVWLSPKKTSPFAFYQFWINVSDQNVEEYLKIFSFLPLVEIANIVEKHNKEPQKRDAQRILAKEITTFVHGSKVTKSVERVSGILFSGEVPQSLTAQDKALISSEVPNVRIQKEELNKGISIIDVLVRAYLAQSKSEAKRLLDGRGVYVNNEVAGVSLVINQHHFRDNLAFVKKGKSIAVLLLS